jgi:hypothetical protein
MFYRWAPTACYVLAVVVMVSSLWLALGWAGVGIAMTLGAAWTCLWACEALPTWWM